MEPVTAELRDVTCGEHGLEATATCARCGAFVCPRCPDARVCALCEVRFGHDASHAATLPGLLLALVGSFSTLVAGVLVVLPFQTTEVLLIAVDVAIRAVALASSLTILVGGFRMLRGNDHRLALIAAVLALVPVCNLAVGCSAIAGAWALAVLLRPEVKEAFAERKRAGL